MRVQALQKSGAKTASLSEERQLILQEFSQRLPYGYAALGDRIGRCVPERIRLTELWIEPLDKRFEEGKALQRQLRKALITGIGPSSSEIGLFTEALVQTAGIQHVRLISVERTRSMELQFKIELRL